MENRTYHILDLTGLTEIQITDSLDECIGLNITQRYSLDGTKLFVKSAGDIVCNLDKCTEYTLEEVIVILNGLDWQLPIE